MLDCRYVPIFDSVVDTAIFLYRYRPVYLLTDRPCSAVKVLSVGYCVQSGNGTIEKIRDCG